MHIIFKFTEYLVSELMAARMLTYRESHPEDADPNCETNGKEQRKRESLTMGNEDEHQETSQVEEDKTNWKEVNKSLAELLSLSSSSSDSSKRVLMRLYCWVISALSKSVVEVIVAIEMQGNEGDQTPQRATQTQNSGMPEIDDLKGERDERGV